MNIGFCELYETDKITPSPFNLHSIGTLLELSMGLAAWKEYRGERWSLRCNPSSGNLHPTEAYLISTGDVGLEPGVYHYVGHNHALERRCVFEAPVETTTVPGLVIGLSSVYWREAWKYGERAFRYCQLDTGHAMAAIRYACALLGWRARWGWEADDNAVEQLLGLNRAEDFGDAEAENPDLLLHITPGNAASVACDVDRLVHYVHQGQWSGTANTLDPRHLYDWPIIEEVAQATHTDQPAEVTPWSPAALPALLPCKTELAAKLIIQRRRSAQMFDGQTAMEVDDFFRLLDALMPRPNITPWDVMSRQPRIHLILFVHRVNGLEPGLYTLLRNEQVLDSLTSALADTLEWSAIDNAPDHLRLFRLVKANAQKAAATLSCHQRIASDSAFSLAMLSEFDSALETGPWAYKHLYWEAGMLGQVLYLEAEAAELQGTGIGCFFDDPVHELLGIKGTQFQSLYHFTVGGALNDSRLRTLLPYGHLNLT